MWAMLVDRPELALLPDVCELLTQWARAGTLRARRGRPRDTGAWSPLTLKVDARVIALGPNLPAIPERLLPAHARGEALFIAGAGISRSAGLPDFRQLVLDVYEKLDKPIHDVLSKIPSTACNRWKADISGLTNQQSAEVKRFIVGDYDVVLGMLERRMDGQSSPPSSVRQAIAENLRRPGLRPAPIHRALMRLADRGGAVTIVTTNFEQLLEDAAEATQSKVQTSRWNPATGAYNRLCRRPAYSWRPSLLEKRPAAVFRTSPPFPPAKSVVFAGCASGGHLRRACASPTRC
jgi:hypothetical protein